MSDYISKTTNSLSGLDPSLYSVPQEEAAKSNQIGKDEFLQLLVTQLKHQDPLDPMKDEQFAVNLAQFSQLEQLISINDKVGADSGTDFSSLAAYLGHQVTLNTNKITVQSGEVGQVSFDLDSASENVRIELLNENDQVVASKDLGQFAAGKHTVELDQLNANDGEYSIRLVSQSVTGSEQEVQGFAAGIVNGFIPGPEAVLLVDGQEVGLADIREVNVASAGQ
jgi:flagellar basal-body rod modification protein FlgD